LVARVRRRTTGIVRGTEIDVTEREEFTPTPRKSEGSLRLLVDGIAALVMTMTTDDELELVNQQVLDYFGKTAEGMRDWRGNGAIHPNDLGPVVAAWTNSLQTGHPYDHVHRYRRSDGIYRWFRVRGRPARDAQGRIIRWYLVPTDIEELKQAEEMLEGQRKELQQVLDLTPQVMARIAGFWPVTTRCASTRGSRCVGTWRARISRIAREPRGDCHHGGTPRSLFRQPIVRCQGGKPTFCE
jgi:PAS domain S-box-containing protein